MDENTAMKEQIRTLPDQPGVYKFFDSEGTIIYVGKAKNLKKRVTSYFNKTGQSYKTQKLVSMITNMEFVVVNTESDALLLENNLIKNHLPKYNILLKDDKTFPYICVTHEPFPRIFTIRNKKIRGDYFGPYTSARSMRSLLDLIRKLYTIRSCSLNLTQNNIKQGKFKICLEYHIGNCKGPCEGLQTEDDYLKDIELIKLMLKGRISVVKEALKSKMHTLSSNFEFEKAHKMKENIEQLEYFQVKSTVVTPNLGDLEVYTVDSYESYVYVNFLQVIEGRITQTDTTRFKQVLEETPKEVLDLYITNIRLETNSEIKEIVSNIELDNEWGTKVSTPERGEKKQLIDLSLKNIKEYQFDKKLQKEQSKGKEIRVLEELRQQLRLKDLPKRIECFDNSNIQGSDPVAGMVCFIDGKPAKREYRTFKVKTVIGPDDFASMFEIVTRRYKRQLEENGELPDLIIIDGGKGQLSASCEALQAVGLYGKIPIISIAKRLEEIYVPNDEFPLHIDKKSESLKLIQRIRDEVHRFAITFHRDQRSKNAYNLELEGVKGMGTKTVEALYKHFGSLKKIKAASEAELTPIIGKAKTSILLKYFNASE